MRNFSTSIYVSRDRLFGCNFFCHTQPPLPPPTYSPLESVASSFFWRAILAASYPARTKATKARWSDTDRWVGCGRAHLAMYVAKRTYLSKVSRTSFLGLALRSKGFSRWKSVPGVVFGCVEWAPRGRSCFCASTS